MAVMVVARSVFITWDEVKGERASVVVSVEVVGPDHVFVEGEMIINKYGLVLESDLSDKDLLGDL